MHRRAVPLLRSSIAAFALVACTLAGRTALGAEPDDAREQSRAAFRRGVTQAQAQDYAGARDAFVEAHRLFPHPSILLNLGLVRVRLGEHLQAERDLLQFLADDGGAPPEELQSARAALATARAHLGTVRVRVAQPAAQTTLDGDAVPLAPSQFTDVRVQEGTHVLDVAAEGYVGKRVELQVRGGGSVDADVALDRTPPEKPPGASAARTAVGVGLLSTGGLAVVLGIGFGVHAIGRADAYNSPGTPDFQDPDTKSEGVAFRTAADVSIILGSAFVLAGATVLLWPTPKPRATGARLQLGPSWAGVTGSF